VKTTYVFRDGQVVEKPKAPVIEALDWDPADKSIWDSYHRLHDEILRAYGWRRSYLGEWTL
jgi:hypothetical protein